MHNTFGGLGIMAKPTHWSILH